MQNQKLCLKWNNHMSNMLSLLGSFQQKDMLVDVTISCQGQNIKAHKVILSACSQYFQNIFMENPCQHPIIIINGMKFEDVSAILNFMYKGEVNVSQDGLSSFLQAAEALKVKGLAEVCGEKKGTNSITQEVQQSEVNRPQRTDTPPRKRPRNRKRSLSDSNRSDDEGLTRKHREPSSPEVHELSGDESFTGDNSSNGPPFNSVPRVPHNVYSHSRSHQSSNIADEDEEYDVESNKMLDTSDSNVSMNNNADNNLRIERIMGNTEIESSSLQEPESPPDIKPIISYGESSAGTSESGAMMLYNEQSQPGPSNAQDGSLLHDNSHTQDDLLGFCEIEASKPDDEYKRTLYMCSDCNYICGLLRSMKQHKRACTGEKGSSNKGLKDSVKLRLYVCSECEYSCSSENEMKLHYTTCSGGKVSVACQTIEQDQNLTSTPLVVLARPCSNLAGASTAEQTVAESKTKVSTECQTDPVKFVRGKDERIDCTYCTYSTTKLHNFKLHLNSHTGEKPHGCSYCDKKFALKSNLTTHERTHTGQRPFSCDVCNKAFASKCVRDRHKIRWHTEERPFVCEICFMGFKFKLDLKNHKKTHNFG